MDPTSLCGAVCQVGSEFWSWCRCSCRNAIGKDPSGMQALCEVLKHQPLLGSWKWIVACLLVFFLVCYHASCSEVQSYNWPRRLAKQSREQRGCQVRWRNASSKHHCKRPSLGHRLTMSHCLLFATWSGSESLLWWMSFGTKLALRLLIWISPGMTSVLMVVLLCWKDLAPMPTVLFCRVQHTKHNTSSLKAA